MDFVTDSPIAWAQLITDNFISLSISDADPHFEGRLRRCALGNGVHLSSVATQRSRVRRGPGEVRADAVDDLLLLTPLTGRVCVRQEGAESVLDPGAVSVHVAERPYELRFDEPSCVIVLQAPRDVVPSADLLSVERRRTVVSGAMAHVFRAFASETLAATDRFSDRERDELGTVAAGLAVSVLGDPQDFVGSSAVAGLVVASAREFIRSRLSDPGLTPAAVAAAQRVSLRSLQQAFAEAESSPASYIRSERLRRSRSLLSDPRHAGSSVAQIARRVGFVDASVFIRAFKRQHGITPGAWRSGSCSR